MRVYMVNTKTCRACKDEEIVVSGLPLQGGRGNIEKGFFSVTASVKKDKRHQFFLDFLQPPYIRVFQNALNPFDQSHSSFISAPGYANGNVRFS